MAHDMQSIYTNVTELGKPTDILAKALFSSFIMSVEVKQKEQS